MEGKYDYGYRAIENKEHPLVHIAHLCDMMASQVVERSRPIVLGHKTLGACFQGSFPKNEAPDPMDTPAVAIKIPTADPDPAPVG